MTTESVYPDDDPRRLLSRARELTRRVRADQRATWFPLLVFAAVTFALVPVLRFSTVHLATCPSMNPPGRVSCVGYRPAVAVYWPAALVLAYAAIAAFYLRRSAARGVGTRVRPYVIAGIILTAAMTATSLWSLYHPGFEGNSPFHANLLLFSYPGAIGIALLVLAWAERNRPLVALILAYFVSVLISTSINVPAPPGVNQHTSVYTLIHTLNLHGPQPLAYLRAILPGAVLLAGGIGFLLAQRPWQRRS
jgi:hypothetical protein